MTIKAALTSAFNQPTIHETPTPLPTNEAFVSLTNAFSDPTVYETPTPLPTKYFFDD